MTARRGDFLMHVKCIHELCTITLVFHSYLHHIRDILLLFNDFWQLIMIFPFYGINPAQAEKPYFFSYLFQGLYDIIMSYKFTGIIILEGGRPRSERSQGTEAGGAEESAPRGYSTRPCGPTSFGPRGPVCVEPSP